MSLPERKRSAWGAVLTSTLLVSSLSVAACTVRPLYSNSAALSPGGGTTQSELSSIAIKPVTTRYAQQVRNHLIFLFNGGKGEPANATYSLTLNVTEINEATAIVQINDEDQPTAGAIVMTAAYSLTQGDKVVASGTRQISSSYDAPFQEFANLRAQRDAENRAARELAELVRLAVAQDLLRKPAS